MARSAVHGEQEGTFRSTKHRVLDQNQCLAVWTATDGNALAALQRVTSTAREPPHKISQTQERCNNENRRSGITIERNQSAVTVW